MNFARLNHILIPTRKDQRERLRRTLLGRAVRPVAWLYEALSAEGRVLAVLCLFIGTAAMEVVTTEVYILFSALVGLLLGSIIMRIALRMRGVRLEVRAPRRVAVGEEIHFTLALCNEGNQRWCSIRLQGPFLPWDGRYLSPPPTVATLAPEEIELREMRARFIQRGEHYLDVFEATSLVPLGLAVGPAVRSRGCRFLVVPAIAAVERIALPSGHRYQPGGVAHASHTGEAMELVGVRPYRAGDAVRDLHARTWARTGAPHVREYQQEYFSRIGVILDNDRRRSTERGLEACISLTAGLIANLTRGEALIDLLVISGELHAFTLGRSLGYLDQALDLLACVEPGPELDVDELFVKLLPHLSQLSCVVLVTQHDPTANHAPPDQHDDRSELAARIENRGVCCRLVRVVDGSSPWPLGGTAEEPDLGDELSVSVADIERATSEGDRPLTL